MNSQSRPPAVTVATTGITADERLSVKRDTGADAGGDGLSRAAREPSLRESATARA